MNDAIVRTVFAAMALVWGLFLGALVTFVVMLPPADIDPFDGHCYVVIARDGSAHPSDLEPTVGRYGVAYKTDTEEGIVFAPNVARIDAVCVSEVQR